MKNQENQLAVQEPKGFEVQTIDLSTGFPNLDNADVIPVDLMADYWTPENSGEEKRVIFIEVKNRTVISQDPDAAGEVLDLACAYFATQENGEIKTVSNGSKRLVAALENFGAQRGMPFLITYLGKKKNATNAFKSDNWSVKPLRLAV